MHLSRGNPASASSYEFHQSIEKYFSPGNESLRKRINSREASVTDILRALA